MMLFNFSQIQQAIREPGNRTAWEGMHTSFDYDQVKRLLYTSRGRTPPLVPVAAEDLAVGWQGRTACTSHVACRPATPSNKPTNSSHKLGQAHRGLKSYRPYQATGEDFLHNFLGMAGIPIDLYPTFPADANTLLLTEAAKYDPGHRHQNKSSNSPPAKNDHRHLRPRQSSLQGKSRASPGGLNDICELEFTGNRVQSHRFPRAGRR